MALLMSASQRPAAPSLPCTWLRWHHLANTGRGAVVLRLLWHPPPIKTLMVHLGGPSPAFKMKVTGVYGKDALLRQVTEGVQINAASEDKKCMNSRAEWNHQTIPRITLMDD